MPKTLSGLHAILTAILICKFGSIFYKFFKKKNIFTPTFLTFVSILKKGVP